MEKVWEQQCLGEIEVFVLAFDLHSRQFQDANLLRQIILNHFNFRKFLWDNIVCIKTTELSITEVPQYEHNFGFCSLSRVPIFSIELWLYWPLLSGSQSSQCQMDFEMGWI